MDEKLEISDSEILAHQFSALSHPARIDILRHLSTHADCGCKSIVSHLPLAQSTVSQHLKVLLEAGLITCKVEPPHSRYNLDKKAFNGLSGSVSILVKTCCSSKCCK